MSSRTSHVDGYNLIFARYSSWVVHNELKDSRTPIIEALSAYFQNPLPNYQPRKWIYYPHPYTHQGIEGYLGILFAADRPTEKPRNIWVSAIQLPLATNQAQPGQPNCHWMTEIVPAEDHSLVPVSYEFARGTTPSKRLNYVVFAHDRSCLQVDPSAGPLSGFQHFISAAYSKYGLAILDFQLTIPNRPTSIPHTPLTQNGWTKDQFSSRLLEDLTCPLRHIAKELAADIGILAPSDLTNIDAFLDTVNSRVVEAVYSNLVIYTEERASNVNPRLQKERFGGNIVIPTATEIPALDTDMIARTLARSTGALEILLLLADHKIARIDNGLMKDLVHKEAIPDTLQALEKSNLVESDGLSFWLTATGVSIVQKLRRMGEQNGA